MRFFEEFPERLGLEDADCGFEQNGLLLVGNDDGAGGTYEPCHTHSVAASASASTTATATAIAAIAAAAAAAATVALLKSLLKSLLLLLLLPGYSH